VKNLLKTNDKENKIHFDLLNKLKKELDQGEINKFQEFE
jgi:hypothetical protein